MNIVGKIVELETQMKQMEVEYQRMIGAVAVLRNLLAEQDDEQHSESVEPTQEG
jgi:hypothetical protein